MKYSDERRNDPEIQDKVRKVVQARYTAMVRAEVLLKKAAEIMREVSYPDGHGEIFERNFRDVFSTHRKLAEDTHFMSNIGGDTYIRNLSAGKLGEQIEKMGDDFPF